MELLVALLFILLPPCAVEDGTFCSWDAAHQGNGVGYSFITFDEGHTYYL